jgi:hypothetical protein
MLAMPVAGQKLCKIYNENRLTRQPTSSRRRSRKFCQQAPDLPWISEFRGALKAIKRFIHIKPDAVHIFYKWLVPDHGMATQFSLQNRRKL